MADEVQMKVCVKCKIEFPNTNEFFDKRKDSKDGLRTNCKLCRRIWVNESRSKSERKQKQYSKPYDEEQKRARKQYNMDNKERRKQYKKDNADYIAEHSKKYRANNTQRIAERAKQYKENNREYFTIVSQRRRATKESMLSDFTVEQWEACLLYFDYKDAYTGLPMDSSSQDHVIPLSKGGNYTISNIIPCERCVNSSKGNKDMATWYKKQTYYDVEREKKILAYVEMVSQD